jgi:heme exporter protein CcmD
MNGWLEWAAMSGHGAYVWASVAALGAMVAAEVLVLRGRHRRALRDITRRLS